MQEVIGIMGTGRMAVRLARLFANCGQQVLLGSREQERAERIAAGLADSRITGVDYWTAVKADIVLPAIFIRDGLLDQLEPFRRELEEKILIDITNPFNDRYDDFILPWNSSGSEALQQRFPRTKIVGAFKNVWWEVFDQPSFAGELSDVFVVSDDPVAKQRFFRLVQGSPFRYLDAGELKNARFVERMTLFLGELGKRYGYFPRMNWRLMGEPWQLGQADQLQQLIAK